MLRPKVQMIQLSFSVYYGRVSGLKPPDVPDSLRNERLSGMSADEPVCYLKVEASRFGHLAGLLFTSWMSNWYRYLVMAGTVLNP